jgi:phosphatidylserine/phosphatidylglycerophosphate/cardiolipin synthase-like enzyme
MYAVALSNNDMVYLYWHVEEKIPGCLGFSILRHEGNDGKGVPLPAMVGFPGSTTAGKRFKDTNVWPIQSFTWKDLFVRRGGTYWYEIVPMIEGTSGRLDPDTSLALRTNSVSVVPTHGNCSVFFNRGIISTQAIAKSLPKTAKGAPSAAALEAAIRKPNSSIRDRLAADLDDGVLTLLERAKKEGGHCYCALYELSDPVLVEALTRLEGRAHVVLSNAGEDTEEGAGDGDKTNQAARQTLRDAGLDLTDRMLKKGHIGHNKFVVYARNRRPVAVLTGSTNWTPNGLCAQSNNAILIESKELAEQYLAYWKLLKGDTDAAGGDAADLQDQPFRAANASAKKPCELTADGNVPAGAVQPWFSPNTAQKSVPRRKNADGSKKTPPSPPDLAEVFSLIEGARQGVLFLAFIPGSPSIVSKLKEVYDARRAAGELFYLRGAATSPDPAELFRVDLYHRSSKSDASVSGTAPAAGRPGVASVAGIYAAFAQWETEIYKIGHAVIHDKILVIDPFTENSVVVTGSHNLGFKASYCNDENLLIVKGDRVVAEAYAAHILDVYQHYRWRWRLQEPLRKAFEQEKKKHPDAKPADLWRKVVEEVGPKTLAKAWQTLDTTDAWQDYYQENKDFLAAEVNFWSPFGGVAMSAGHPPDPAARRTPR